MTEFINARGKECNTCKKCREKDKKRVMTDERRAARNKLQKEKKYYKEWREKKRAENESITMKYTKNGKTKIQIILQIGTENP